MEAVHGSQRVRVIADSLVAQAVVDDVPRPLAEEIAAITLRKLGLDPRSLATERDSIRVRAYYSEVVRRRTMSGAAGPRAVARLVAAAVVADLRETGRDGRAIFDHLRRGWSERIPPDVLEEYRVRLCG
jgi:hypothetical protein